ncbi:hypothetical protein [Methylocystis parvus]|uniref:hypothetical protein n=1 Tax=Methylocystis parvus TaxID=134 RepID=UPI003C75466A
MKSLSLIFVLALIALPARVQAASSVLTMSGIELYGFFSASNSCALSGNFSFSTSVQKEPGTGGTTTPGGFVFANVSCPGTNALCAGGFTQVNISSNPPTPTQLPKTVVASGTAPLTLLIGSGDCGGPLEMRLSATAVGIPFTTSFTAHQTYPSTTNPQVVVMYDEHTTGNATDAIGTLTVNYGGQPLTASVAGLTFSNSKSHRVEIVGAPAGVGLLGAPLR